MKKFLIAFCCFMSVICISLFSGCDIFNNNQLNLNSNENSNDENFSQYFIVECPMALEAKFVNNYSDLQLKFINTSDKKIIAYESIFILYNVYGEKLKYLWNDSSYNKLAETPNNLIQDSSDSHYISISSQTYSAEIFIYYVLFEDQTSWGCRTDIPVEEVIELGAKYKIER